MIQKLTPKQLRERNQSIREQGVPLLLPCGLEVRVRNVPLAAFYASGAIPDSLSPLVDELINGKTPDVNKVGLGKVFEAQTAMFRAVLQMAVVSPKIVEHPQTEDEVGFDDFEDEDASALLGLLGLPARALERFCQEQTRVVQTLLTEQDVSSASEPSLRD